MNMATIVVSGVYAHARMYSTIPAGIVGAEVTFEFTDPIWEGLTKTAVFQGVVTRDVILSGSTAIIPAETVAKAGPMLKVGIYGVDAENNLVIPTLWAAIGGIRDAADPSDDPGTDPELPIWAQLADRVEGVAKDVEELKQTGGVGPGGNVDFQTDETLTLKNGVLSVNTTNDMEQDNTLPITSAGVFATVGNIEALLKTI